MAILDRLIRKEEPDSLAASKIIQVDIAARQIQVTLRGATVWAAFDPAGYPSLAAGDDVLVGKASGAFYLVGTVPKTMPNQVTLLEV